MLIFTHICIFDPKKLCDQFVIAIGHQHSHVCGSSQDCSCKIHDSLHLTGVFALFLEEGRRSMLPCVICWGLAALSWHLFTPPGDTTGQDSWCGFGEVWGWGRADMGVHVGGWDYRWAAVDGEGGREGGRAGRGELWEELLSTKDTSARLNGQWPRTIRWMIMASTSGDLGPECVSVCVCVCGEGHSCQLVSQSPCRLRKNRSCGSLDDVIRTQMTDVWPT